MKIILTRWIETKELTGLIGGIHKFPTFSGTSWSSHFEINWLWEIIQKGFFSSKNNVWDKCSHNIDVYNPQLLRPGDKNMKQRRSSKESWAFLRILRIIENPGTWNFLKWKKNWYRILQWILLLLYLLLWLNDIAMLGASDPKISKNLEYCKKKFSLPKFDKPKIKNREKNKRVPPCLF